MKKILFAFAAVALLARPALAVETQTVEQSGIVLPVAAEEMQPIEPQQPFIIDVSWKNFMDNEIVFNVADIEPAAGGADPGDEGFMVSLTDNASPATDPDALKQKFELAYTTKRNFSLRTKHSGLMLYKRIRFEPRRAPAMPPSTVDIGKPQFSE